MKKRRYAWTSHSCNRPFTDARSLFKNQEKLQNLKSLQTNLSRLLKEYGFALSNDGKTLDVLKKLEEENVVLREKVG
jgi:hypothetical protein